MRQRQRVVKALFYGLISLSVAIPLHASRAADPDSVIKYRQAVMKSQGGHMTAAAEIIKGKVDFGSDLQYHAMALDASSDGLLKLFPDGSDFGDTRAKEEIWKNHSEFEKAAKNAAQAGNKFLAAVKSNDKAAIAKAYEDLAEACKDCHKKFREKKE